MKVLDWMLTFTLAFLNTYVASVLWAWFVVPLGPPPLPFWHAYGLLGLVGLVKVRINARDIQWAREASTEEALHMSLTRSGMHLSYTLLFWLFGWVAHYFMVHG